MIFNSETDIDCGGVLSCSHREQIFVFRMSGFYNTRYMTVKFFTHISKRKIYVIDTDIRSFTSFHEMAE